MIRLILADDHQILLQGLSTLLQSVNDIEIVGQATNGTDTLKLIRREEPDIAVIDISMPGLNGLEVTRKVQEQGLKTRMILLTIHREALTAYKALKTGALGYVLKDTAFDELLNAVRSVYAGNRFITPSVAGELFDLQSTGNANRPSLTKRETEVLGLIASGLTNREISVQLFISIKTVETHRSKIMQKLDLHRTADLVRYAVREKLVEV